jgi:predicted nucleic acid binding AN1-type Zn finger protein
MTMSKHHQEELPEENDPVWDLLSRDAVAHPVAPSPWFATRVAAKALATTQRGRRSPSLILRWLIPIPLACSALLALAAWNHSRTAEEKFEQHMEFLASSSYDYEV